MIQERCWFSQINFFNEYFPHRIKLLFPPLGLRVLYDFRSFCCMKEFGDGFDGVTFTTFIRTVAETAIVAFHTLPVGFPLPTISKNSLYTLFCPLILDHGVFSKFPFLAPIFLFRISCSILLFAIVFNLCYSGPNFCWWVSRSYISNTVLSFSDSRILNLYKHSKMSSCGVFVIDNKIPSHLNRIPEYHHFVDW